MCGPWAGPPPACAASALEASDAVVALGVVDPNATLLVAGENGIGKRTEFSEYRVQSRGGKGIITMKTTDKTGPVIGALTVRDSDEIMLITQTGQMVRIAVKGIRETSRNTMGVKLINLHDGDRLIAIAPVINEENGEGEAAAEAAEPNLPGLPQDRPSPTDSEPPPPEA